MIDEVVYCMNDINLKIRETLFSLKDDEYKAFISKLNPTVCEDSIIGIRTPILRKEAKQIFKEGEYEPFLHSLPHKYYEENNVHSFIIEQIKDYDAVINELDRFLPFVDNWATCDSMRPKIFSKHKKELYEKIKEWLCSEHEYTVRFGIEMLMSHFLDDDFKAEHLEIPAAVRSEEYYVNMMIAWFFATALAKQWDSTLPYIENRRLDKWTHNKTIQKARESYRITDEQKKYLRMLR